MPSAKELAKALARQDSVTQQPRNRFLGAIADAAGYVSDQADRYVVPERDPLFGGMRGGDLLPLRNVNRLLDDLSYGGRITTGRGQTTTLRPEVVDTVALGGAMMPAAKSLGKAAAMKAAEQVQDRTGFARLMPDTRMRMFAGEGAKTADKGALKVAKDMQAAGVPDETIHAKTKWFFGSADGKPRFEIDDSAAKLRMMPRANQMLKAQTVDDFMAHPELLSAHPNLAKTDIRLSRSESGSKGAYLPEQNTIELAGLSDTAPYSMANDVKSTTLHELQHAIQQREGFARGGSPSDFKTKAIPPKLKDVAFGRDMREMAISQRLSNAGVPIADGKYHNLSDPKIMEKARTLADSDPVVATYIDEYLSRSKQLEKYPTAAQQYRRLAGEAEARLTQSRMNMNPAERAASYPPSMFDVPVKDQIVRYGDAQAMSVPERNGVGGAMIQRPKTEFEILHDTAQRNAALPVEQGGLGLPANNTGMDRAGAMGFDTDTPYYHGTDYDFDKFNTAGKGKTAGSGAFLTNNPVVAETYVGGVGSGGNIIPLLARKENLLEVNAKGRNWSDINTNDLAHKRKKLSNIFPDDISPNDFTTTDQIAALAPYADFSGALIKNIRDSGPSSHVFRSKEYLQDKYGIPNTGSDTYWKDVTGDQFAEARNATDKLYSNQRGDVLSLQNPQDIRSRFAAFDPMRRHEADILAGVGVGGMLDPQAIAEALRQRDRK